MGHSTQPVHQEWSTHPPGGHCGDLSAFELRSIGGEDRQGYIQKKVIKVNISLAGETTPVTLVILHVYYFPSNSMDVFHTKTQTL